MHKKGVTMEEELNCAPLQRSNPKWKKEGEETPKEKPKAKY
jgi:hypothetical protein